MTNDNLKVYKYIILQTKLHKSTAENFQCVNGRRVLKYQNYMGILIKEGSGLHEHPYLETS